MKRTISLLLSLVVATACFAQGEPRQLAAIFSCATFNEPQGTPYVETYFVFDGNSLAYRPLGGGRWQATVEMTLTVTRGDTVVHTKRYELNSPVSSLDEGESYEEFEMPDFIDMQRFALPNGEYTVRFTLRDTNSGHQPVELEEQLSLAYGGQPQLSSVQPMASAVKTTKTNILSRGGYDMMPYISDYYPEEVKTLSFYYEIYNIDREVGEADFLTSAYIEHRETGSRFEASSIAKRQKSKGLIPVYQSLDISDLPSGNYYLVVEARNKANDLMLYQRVPFMRNNPAIAGSAFTPVLPPFVTNITDEETLDFYLSALYPIAIPREEKAADELVKSSGRLLEKQVFFYEFWLSRDNLNPEAQWNEYRKRLDYVEENFTWKNQRGYLSDRGRVYLKYGAPDFVRDEKNFVATRLGHGNHAVSPTRYVFDNPGQGNSQGQIFYLPYQLWRYNSLPGDDINRCFIFWDQMRSGKYNLLHSNAKGEVQEYGWERRLSQQQLEEETVGAVGEQFNRGF